MILSPDRLAAREGGGGIPRLGGGGGGGGEEEEEGDEEEDASLFIVSGINESELALILELAIRVEKGGGGGIAARGESVGTPFVL